MYLKKKEIERKEKIQKSLLHPSYTHSPYQKNSYINPPPISMTTLISKLLPLFVTSDKGQVHQVNISSSLGELVPSSSSASSLPKPSSLLASDASGEGEEATVKTTHGSLSSCNTIDTSAHLTQLITESVKASIHVHKLCHDGLKCHSTRRRRRSGSGWSGRSWRSYHLCLGPPSSKLCLTSSNSSSIYGTHHRKMRRDGKGDRKMAKYLHDSRRKNKLITGRRIPIDIYKG